METEHLLEIDRKIAIEIMNYDVNETLTKYKNKCLLNNNDILFFEPTTNMNHALIVAKKIDLFKDYALHYQLGAYSLEWNWCISKIDNRGVLQGFVAEKTPELAISKASLKYFLNN